MDLRGMGKKGSARRWHMDTEYLLPDFCRGEGVGGVALSALLLSALIIAIRSSFS